MPPDSTRLVILEDCIIMFYSDRNHLAVQKESSAFLEAEAEIQNHSNQKIARKQCTRLRASRREYNMRNESSVRDYAHQTSADVNTT